VLEFAKLIDLIVGFASPVVQHKLQRHELVIKLLKQLNLDPDHPPADFTAVYQYTLVEYGIGKPKPVLEIFRQFEIQAIFRKALDQNNSALLLQEGERFLSSHVLGDQIRELGIDARREFYQFAAIFIEVAKRTRTPAEVLTNQRLESLHRQIGTVQERLTRLPTLEGMRTEMARLAAQSLALPAAESQDQQCRAFALAQQVKGWFETLGYRFEAHEVWQDDYFEWVINIPVRRGRYDRILVRGMEGAAEIGDVGMLGQSVEQQRTDEGWLVTTRRISRAARTEVEKPENAHLGCYTLDELLDQDADFSGYLSWLEAEIQQRQIEQKYVPLACTKEELDPVTQQRIAVSRYDDRDGWIDGYIDQWLDDPAKEHISVLGEFGTGKTWFALHYAWVALQRYRDAQRRGVDRPRLPLVIPLRDYAKAVSVESLFSEFFFRKHEIPIPGYSAFEQLNRMGKLLLIFDGFDEMAARVDRQEMINNFWELAKIVVPGAKVILTCRTEHFPEVKEGRALLNAELKASTINLNEDTPQFEVLELEKFDDEQIQQVLALQTSPEVVQQVMNNAQLLDLARRPVMTELILEALPDIEAGKPVDMSRVYLYAVRRKMERDIKEERTFTSLAEKLYFLCELSWEMLSTDRMSLNYREFPDRIRRLFGSVVQEEKNLDHWHYDMMGQTMLIRNADGDYMPAHRSLLEFFVAYKFAAELGALAPDFLELAQMQPCVDTTLRPRDYHWSEYFGHREKQIAPLKEFVSESLEVLRSGFGQISLPKAVLDLILPMLHVSVAHYSSLQNILDTVRGKTKVEVDYVGGNIATLLVTMDENALEGRDLSHSILQGANFTNASLRHANFSEADLTNSIFLEAFGLLLSVAFSPKAQLFVTGGADGELRFWQVNNGEQVLKFRGHSNWISSVAFTSDGLILASGGHEGIVKLWNSDSGKCLRIMAGHAGAVRSIAFNSDGTILASSSDDKTIKLWNVQTGSCLKTFQGHTDRVWTIAISPDKKTLASGSFDETIKFWDIDSEQCLKTLEGQTKSVLSLVFSYDGKILASGSSDNTVKLWNPLTHECIKILEGHTRSVRSIAFSQDNKTLASGSRDQTIKFWDVSTGECIKTVEGHSARVREIAFNSDNTIFVSISDDQTVKLWDTRTGNCLKTFQGNSRWIDSVVVSPDGKFLAVGSNDKTVKLWNISTGDCFRTLKGHLKWISSVAISLDGKTLASGSGDDTAKLWDIHTGACLKTLYGHNNRMAEVVFSPDGATLVSCDNNGTIKLWNILSGECLKTLQGQHDSWINSVAISPDGATIASVSTDQTVKLWDVNSGECREVLTGHTDSVRSVAIAPNGEFLASGSRDQTVKTWNLYTGEYLETLQGHASEIDSVSFSCDSKFLATGSLDHTVKLWDVYTGKCLKTFKGHTNRVRSVTFVPDNRTLVSGGYDETIKFWDIESGECLKTLSNKPYEGMNITGVKGLTEAEKATLTALGAIEN
jgi:predicted NACHT family NTPase